MKKLFSPWRTSYAASKGEEKGEEVSESKCLFCGIVRNDLPDHDEYVLSRGNTNYVLLNRYPYNAGHLLVVPNRHVKVLDELSHQERTELMEQLNRATTQLQSVFHPDGINIGLNLGKAAGAGIPSHLHIHILPRWEGDTNFMPCLAQTKVISFDLNEVYSKLKPFF